MPNCGCLGVRLLRTTGRLRQGDDSPPFDSSRPASPDPATVRKTGIFWERSKGGERKTIYVARDENSLKSPNLFQINALLRTDSTTFHVYFLFWVINFVCNSARAAKYTGCSEPSRRVRERRREPDSGTGRGGQLETTWNLLFLLPLVFGPVLANDNEQANGCCGRADRAKPRLAEAVQHQRLIISPLSPHLPSLGGLQLPTNKHVGFIQNSEVRPMSAHRLGCFNPPL